MIGWERAIFLNQENAKENSDNFLGWLQGQHA
jgi:hypothetical protein